MKSTLAHIIIVLSLAFGSSGCSDEFLDCVAEFQKCSEQCPDSEQQAAMVAAANAAYRDCMSDCPPLDPNASDAAQMAATRCATACGRTKSEALAAATACDETCEDEFAECTAAILGCSDPVSSRYLVPVVVADWDPHNSATLADPNHGIAVCDDHFPPSSPERYEVERAINQFSWIPGSDIDLYDTGHAHRDKSELFSDQPAASTFDYVDNAADTFVHPCHPDNTTSCFDDDDASPPINGFVINTCSYANGQWQGSGDRELFSITANGACYGYFSNPTSSDYVSNSGALHELGHATGMNHVCGDSDCSTANSWPVADRPYISTMQGNLEYLSAYDTAYLRVFYPASFTAPNRNFVASSKIRLDYGTATAVTETFAEENPSAIYLVNDVIYDCSSQQPAVFYAAWFNTGSSAQEADHCMINELRLEDPSTLHEARIKRLHAATMPPESQDQWTGTSDSTAADFVGISLGREIDLVFEVNVYEQYRERDSDNIVKSKVRLYGSSSCNSVPVLPLKSSPIRQIGPNSYDIEADFLTQTVIDPGLVTRGVSLVPATVGGEWLGFKIVRLEQDSVLNRMGAKRGDVLWRIDGEPIHSIAAGFQAVQRLRAGKRVSVAIARDESLRELSYQLRRPAQD